MYKGLLVLLLSFVLVGCGSKPVKPDPVVPTAEQQLELMQAQLAASRTIIDCPGGCRVELPKSDLKMVGFTQPTNKYDAQINRQNKIAWFFGDALKTAAKAYGIHELADFGKELVNARGDTITTTTTTDNGVYTESHSVIEGSYNTESVTTNATDSYNVTEDNSVVTTSTDSHDVITTTTTTDSNDTIDNSVDSSDNSTDNTDNSDNSTDNSVVN